MLKVSQAKFRKTDGSVNRNNALRRYYDQKEDQSQSRRPLPARPAGEEDWRQESNRDLKICAACAILDGLHCGSTRLKTNKVHSFLSARIRVIRGPKFLFCPSLKMWEVEHHRWKS
jgi:hypothetical protein